MEKPRLSFWQIWNMSFGFLGIQFGWTLQMNNMSAIYEYLGAQPSQLPILWLAAPLTGLLIQPIIGYWSDNTWGPLGRRRPFFLSGALLSSCALILMPASSALWMAAGLLWILDASINISMEPFRAFVADMLPDEQRPRGFTMQSFFIGVGSVAASYLPLLLRRIIPPTGSSAHAIPQIVRVAFWIGQSPSAKYAPVSTSAICCARSSVCASYMISRDFRQTSYLSSTCSSMVFVSAPGNRRRWRTSARPGATVSATTRAISR